MNKEVPEKFKNMTLEETKKEIIEMIRESVVRRHKGDNTQ